MSIWVYQFQDCIHACVSFNLKHENSSCNESCTAVSYAYNSSYDDLSEGHAAGDCFLKAVLPNSTGLTEVDVAEAVDSPFYTDEGIASGEAVEGR